jgi:hypothetical protein
MPAGLLVTRLLQLTLIANCQTAGLVGVASPVPEAMRNFSSRASWTLRQISRNTRRWVAQRIERFASVIGLERVIAGTDRWCTRHLILAWSVRVFMVGPP